MNRSIKTNEMIVAEDDFNIADYPACISFFPVTETSGNILTCLKTAVAVDYTNNNDAASVTNGSITFSGGGALINGTATREYGNVANGVMPLISSSLNVVAIAVADFAGGSQDSIIFGAYTEPKISMVSNLLVGFDDAVAAPADGIVASLPSSTNSKAFAILHDKDGDTFSGVDVTATTATDIGSAVTPLASLADWDSGANNGALILSAVTKLYGYAVFGFARTVDINEVISVAAWCNYQWRNNKKVLPPQWKNNI